MVSVKILLCSEKKISYDTENELTVYFFFDSASTLTITSGCTATMGSDTGYVSVCSFTSYH